MKIKENVIKNDYHEQIRYWAINDNNKLIFGSDCTVSRYRNDSNKFSEWEIDYGSSGSKTYKNALPFITVLNKTMAKLKELNNES